MRDSLMISAQDLKGSTLRIIAARLLDAKTGTTLVNLPAITDSLVGTLLADVPVGKQRLALDVPGHPTLEFSVEIKGDGDRSFEFTPPTPACATVTGQQASSAKGHSQRVHSVNFTLSPRHEHVVMVAGADLKGGTNYMQFARTWCDDLYHGRTDLGAGSNSSIPRAIRDHTVVSMFDFRRGYLEKYIKGIDGWHRMSRTMQGSVAPDIANPKSEDAVERRQNADSISILHVYAHIDELGNTHPGSVRQLHFFSHGYKCGPVLLNTYDNSNSNSDARDPTDKDPRTKDFLPSNLARFRNFKIAFMPGAYVKAWGCFGSDMVDKLRAVSRTTNIDEQVRVQGKDYTYSSADVIRELRRDTLPDSYMVQFCQTIGVDGWSAPPGVTSSYKRSSRRYYFQINEDVHGDVVAWYERYFGCARDLSGMVSFRKLV